MKNITRWRPDTCECVIDYEWDTENPELEHVVKETTPCAVHQGTHQEVYDGVLEESRRKNKTLGLLMEIPGLTEIITEAKVVGLSVEFVENKVFRRGTKVEHSFDENRKLELKLRGFTQQEKDLIATEIGKLPNKSKIILK